MFHRLLDPVGDRRRCRPHTVRRCAIALASCIATAQADVGPAVTIASGLSNPRGIAFAPNGDLYVAEGGRGGPGPCIPSPSQPVQRCYGDTGSIARILPGGGFERTATGLPSLTLPNGTSEGGPADISFFGTAAYVTIGLGGDPTLVRAALGPKGALLGKMLRVTPSGAWQVVADVAAHEAAHNPAGGTVDSNPYGTLVQPGRRIVADAGANAVIEVLANGRTRTFALPTIPGSTQSVPTTVAEGPDGAIYVGLLTGFPFFATAAPIWRISSDGSMSGTWASGYTAVVDIAFDGAGALYVLEIARGQVGPPTPPNPGLGIGRLMRQCPGSAPAQLLGGLTFPSGVAIGPDGAAYLTHFGTSPVAGEVLRLPLAPCPAQ